MNPVFRFAPSPNGRLHLGHAYSAVLNAQWAARLGGRFLLRLEDIDFTRCTAPLAQHCMDDLAWLGLTWETPVRVQSRHMGDYRSALDRLRALGLLYPCFCSRSTIEAASAARDPDGAPLYPGTCRGRQNPDLGQPHSWRLDMARALRAAPGPHGYIRVDSEMNEQPVSADPARWGDAVLARKDIGVSYHIAVVTDDALQGVSHVLRGQDLEAATDLHVLLQTLLGLPTPHYHHHALLHAAKGEKLAKSKGSESLADLRAAGVTPAKIRAILRI
jgi:glutamyl-Q tRNA(Asp) synthetase